MQLDKWLEKTGHTRKWLAKEIGVSKRRIDTILYGAEPRLAEALAIDEVTMGAVNNQDWIRRAKK
jgi:plasmid maintenance system antidote protein VapI